MNKRFHPEGNLFRPVVCKSICTLDKRILHRVHCANNPIGLVKKKKRGKCHAIKKKTIKKKEISKIYYLKRHCSDSLHFLAVLKLNK